MERLQIFIIEMKKQIQQLKQEILHRADKMENCNSRCGLSTACLKIRFVFLCMCRVPTSVLPHLKETRPRVDQGIGSGP